MAAASTTSYTFTDFQVPGALYTNATGINNLGQIVGYYSADGTTLQSFIDTGGQASVLSAPGNDGNAAASINDFGQIVGRSIEASLTPSGYDIYTSVGYLGSQGQLTSFSVPNSTGAFPSDLNDRGQIVGYFNGSTGDEAFLDDRGNFSTIVPPGVGPVQVGNTTIQPEVFANGINNLGQIVGEYYSYTTSDHGFLDDHGTYTTIDVPGALFTQPRSINDFGVVVGDYVDSAGSHGFIYDHGSFTTIDAPGGANTNLQSINDFGQIVGNAEVGSTGAGFSFLMTPTAGAHGPISLAELLANAHVSPTLFLAQAGSTPASATASAQPIAGFALPANLAVATLPTGAIHLTSAA